MKVLHYLNQFFGGIGGEEHANEPARLVDGAVGPGRAAASSAASARRPAEVASSTSASTSTVLACATYSVHALAMITPIAMSEHNTSGYIMKPPSENNDSR